MPSDDVQSKLDSLKALRKEISTIKKDLDRLNREKEGWYKKRSSFSRQISEGIKGIKSAKDVRNDLTGDVKLLKDKRTGFNRKVNEIVNKIKDERSKIGPTTSSRNGRDVLTPKAAQARKDYLESKLETEALSFDQEKRVMSEIRKLKKVLSEPGVSDSIEVIKELRAELKEVKKEANAIHKQIQTQAKNSQEYHDSIIGTSVELTNLRKQEKEAHEKFMEFKVKFNERNAELKEKLSLIRDFEETLKQEGVTFADDSKKRSDASLKQKVTEVKEKIKSGKKLTMEDLLVYQKG